METKQRNREAVTQTEESLDQRVQSLEQKFASMSICMGNVATFLTMQQERIRALEEQVYKEQLPGTPEGKLASEAQQENKKRLAEQTNMQVHSDDPPLTLCEASRQTPSEQQQGAPPQETSQDMLATEKQRDFLQHLGVEDLAPDLTKEQASALIEGRLHKQEPGLPLQKPPQEAEQTKLATEKQRDFLHRLGVKDLASDLTKEHASVLIEGRLRELRATKTAEPASQPEHTAPQRTTAYNVQQAQKTSGRSHGA